MNRMKSTPLVKGGQSNLRFATVPVLKFGGTSMGSAKAISQVADIVQNLKKDCAIVVSATSGTTDKLIELGRLALENGAWESKLNALINRHEEIIEDLKLDLNLDPFFRDATNLLEGISLIGEISLSANDRLMTIGERVSSNILAVLLEKRGIKAMAMDAYNFVFTDNNFSEANVDFEKTNKAVKKEVGGIIKKGIMPIVTGFVGQSEDGRYSTLGRGGSDYTGAILAAALGACELQIWTDVDGILNTDPRLVPSVKVLERLSFNEAGELAYFGAKVLHPKTIKPAIERGIPVKILNTFNVSAPGTLITNDSVESLKSVTYKKGISIINICSAGMLDAHGFLSRIFEVFAKYKIIVDVVSTSEVSVSVTIDNGISDEALKELEKFSTVNVYKNMAIVCLVGNGIRSDKGVLGRLFGALNEYVVSMVSQGASQRNITFLVSEVEAPEVVKKVYNEFFK